MILAKPSTTPEDEVRLVQRVAEGDASAYRELVLRYASRLRQYAFRITRNEPEAEDVVQETFLRLWLRASDYSPRARVTTWLHRIVHNLSVDKLRARKTDDPIDSERLAVSAPQPDLVDAKRRALALDRALSLLPERQASAVVLVHLQGLSGAEAAEVLGVSAEALESLLARGRRALKAALSREPVVEP